MIEDDIHFDPLFLHPSQFNGNCIPFHFCCFRKKEKEMKWRRYSQRAERIVHCSRQGLGKHCVKWKQVKLYKAAKTKDAPALLTEIKPTIYPIILLWVPSTAACRRLKLSFQEKIHRMQAWDFKSFQRHVVLGLPWLPNQTPKNQ